MEVEEYLGRSRLCRRLRSGPHGQLVERYAARLIEERRVRHGTWRCLNVVGGLLSWMAGRRYKLVDLDEQVVERYLRHRGGRQSIQPGDRAALKRWLSVLREEGAIAPLVLPPLTPHEQIFKEFDAYLRSERGLAQRSIVRHLPVIRRFLHEVCSGGAAALGKISQEDVIRYVERHAQDWSPGTGKAMCWSLRAFLRYLHHRGLNAHPLADCVPSMRRWKLATLPTYLPAAQVRKALDGCDRETVMGRRDYAILLLLAKLCLRADEVATLTLDDIDWARQRDTCSRQGPTACTDADTARRWRGHRCISAQWPAKVVVPTVVRPHTRATRRLCFRICDHHDRQGRSRSRWNRRLRTPRRPYLPTQSRNRASPIWRDLVRDRTVAAAREPRHHPDLREGRHRCAENIEPALAGRRAMTNLRSALDKYLSMRKGLGYKYEHQTRRLADFVAFMEKRKARIITTKLAMQWATLPPDRHASWALRLSDVRGFARHVANFDPRTEVPPVGMLPGWKRAKPYVYSDAEIDALLTAALALPPADGLRRWTYHTLFGLIAVTGMRISEAMGLERDDVDLDAGVLTVRLTKFGKSRLVPLHPTTRTALRDYAHRRDALLRSRCGSTFFVAEQKGRLLHQYVHRVFWRLSRDIGLRRPGDRTGPRVHDFRHRFAIRTLLDWYREGKDVEQQIPVLSTYLGHACVRDTYWYLSACPELMEEAARRLDRRWEVTL